VNANWVIIEALLAQGEAELADTLRERTIALVDAAGCFEYFSPIDGEGHGADDFSWTAALAVDLLERAP
jgi:hypothetical protein